MQRKSCTRVLFLVIVVIYAFSGLELLEGKDANEPFAKTVTDPKRDDSIRISGDYMHAVIVAYGDCEKRLRDRYGDKSTPVTAHVSDIHNYFVLIEKVDEGRTYRVDFWPEPFQGGPIKGGGVSYLIDANTFEIKDVERSM